MEQTQDRITETLCLNRQVFVYSITRNIFYINGLLKRGEGIGTFSTHCTHHFVILVRDCIFRCFAGYAVNLFVDFFAFCLICSAVILRIQFVDLIQ
ncbi:hypothetical protein D3C85_1570520 [compost metagenome]